MYLNFFVFSNQLSFFLFPVFNIKLHLSTKICKQTVQPMNKKKNKTKKQTPKPLDSPKLQEIRAGPDLKLREGKGGERKKKPLKTRGDCYMAEEVNMFKLWGHLTIRQIIDHSFRIWTTTKITKKSFPCYSVFRNEHPFPVSNVKSQ